MYGTVSVFLLEDAGGASLQVDVIGLTNPELPADGSDSTAGPTESVMATYEYSLAGLSEKAASLLSPTSPGKQANGDGGSNPHAKETNSAREELAWRDSGTGMILNVGLELCVFGTRQFGNMLEGTEESHDEISFTDADRSAHEHEFLDV